MHRLALLLLALFPLLACSSGFSGGVFATRAALCPHGQHDNGLGECVALGECATDFRLNPEAGTCSGWVEGPPLEIPSFGHSATRLPNGHVLIAGGYHPEQRALDRVVAYNPIRDVWQAHTALPQPITGHSGLLHYPRGVVLLGGYTASSERLVRRSAHDAYDLAQRTWSSLTLPELANHVAYPLDGDRVFFLSTKPFGDALAHAVADLRTLEVVELPPMQVPRLSPTVLRLRDGRMLLAGGWDEARQPLAAVELLNPDDLTWRRLPELPRPGVRLTLTQLEDGTVLAVGGQNPMQSLADVHLLDLGREQWESVASLRQARSAHTATLLDNGRVMVTGGVDKDSSFDVPAPLASTEIYDPLHKTWYDSGELREPRLGHTATRLKDGRVLVVGGLSLLSAMRAATTTEIFTTGH